MAYEYTFSMRVRRQLAVPSLAHRVCSSVFIATASKSHTSELVGISVRQEPLCALSVERNPGKLACLPRWFIWCKDNVMHWWDKISR